MTPDQRRQFNTTFGGILLGIGIFAWLFSFYFVVVPRDVAPPPIAASSVDLASCQSALADLGYSATEKASEVIAFEALSAMPREQLEKASIAANICHLPLNSFCMGEGCERPGLTLVLRKAVEVAPVAAEAAEGTAQSEAKGRLGTRKKP